jgi:hypothetical protein
MVGKVKPEISKFWADAKITGPMSGAWTMRKKQWKYGDRPVTLVHHSDHPTTVEVIHQDGSKFKLSLRGAGKGRGKRWLNYSSANIGGKYPNGLEITRDHGHISLYKEVFPLASGCPEILTRPTGAPREKTTKRRIERVVEEKVPEELEGNRVEYRGRTVIARMAPKGRKSVHLVNPDGSEILSIQLRTQMGFGSGRLLKVSEEGRSLRYATMVEAEIYNRFAKPEDRVDLSAHKRLLERVGKR